MLASELPEVGVIDSGEFSSLHPGYYVVFSGIYADQRAALQGVGRVQNLYPAAYIRADQPLTFSLEGNGGGDFVTRPRSRIDSVSRGLTTEI